VIKKIAKAKAKEKVEKRRLTKEKEKKKRLEYLQQLYDEILVKSIERSHIVESKYKEIILEDKIKQQSSKKAKEKKPEKYCGNARVKIVDTNTCERYICAR